MHRYFVIPIIAVITTSTPISAQNDSFSGESQTAGAGYAAVDAHADSAPASVERTVVDLANYLALAGSDHSTMARSIYRWITTNIEFDVWGLRTGDFGDLSPSGVLRRRKAVCSGYADLAVALGEMIGIDIEVVIGWSKGYGYTAGQQLDGPANHVWNAVRIDGEWKLMDPTWGAGTLDERMRFTPQFQEHYFLADPEIFIIDHLPENRGWQLLDDPISTDEFVSLAYLQPSFFAAGLELVSHKHVFIETDSILSITVENPHAVVITAQVLATATHRPLEGNLALVQYSDFQTQISSVFPQPGSYLLRLFARPKEEEESLCWVLDYRVNASHGLPDAEYPKAFGEFGMREVHLLEPLEGFLEVGRVYRFSLQVPGASKVAVVGDGIWTYLFQNGSEFSADVMAAPGVVTVCAQFEPEGPCRSLLQYTGR